MKKNIKFQMRCYTLIFLILFMVAFIFTPAICLSQEPFSEKNPMPTSRLTFGTAVVDGKIYVIGGTRTETDPLSVVEVFDPATDTWDITKTPMPTARGTFGCTVVDGRIYAIGGGVIGSHHLRKVEVYDPVTNSWDTTKAPMPTARSAVAACVANGKVYVIGGTLENNPPGGILGGIGIVEEYDPITDTWTRKTDKPTPGWGLRGCVLDGKIYVTGGNIRWPDITAALEVYDPVTDSWDTLRTSMSEPKYSHSISLVNGKIYAFGGWLSSGGGPIYKTVEEYNPNKDIWIKKTDMPIAIAEFGAAIVDSKIYLLGGTSTLHPFTSIKNVYEYDPTLDLIELIDKVNINKGYIAPGSDSVCISATVTDPTGVTLLAEIESPDQSPVDNLELFDDGNHSDGNAGDSLYANVWQVSSPEERLYYVDLKVTRIDTDTVTHQMNNMALFTTIGPVVFDHYTFATSDTVPNPGDRVRLNLFLKNNGSITTATNISAILSSPDTLVDITTDPRNYDDIGAGEIAQSIYTYNINIDDDHPDNTAIPFMLEIFSDNTSYWFGTFDVDIDPTGISTETENIPGKFALFQNYPNPFNPVTNIVYSVRAQRAVPQQVNLSIYNLLGQKVAKLVNKKQPAGHYQVQWDASGFASGIYYYRLQAGDFVETKKLVLLK